MKRLEDNKINILEGPVAKTGATGPIRSVYVRDPDLNLVEISVVAARLELAAVEADVAQHAVVEAAQLAPGLPLPQGGADPADEFGEHDAYSIGRACKFPVVAL